MILIFSLIEPCWCCFKCTPGWGQVSARHFWCLGTLATLQLWGGSECPAQGPLAAVGGEGAHGCHTQPGRLTFMEITRLVLPSPFLPVPLLISVGLDIFGFHRDHKKLQQQFYTQAWLKQNLGSCGYLADKPTLAQCSQMLLRTFPVLV